jgi:hypothetical protein
MVKSKSHNKNLELTEKPPLKLALCTFLKIMNSKDLTPDERSFLIESTDFEKQFWELIDHIHWAHEDLPLPEKFAIAQAVAERLLTSGIMRCIVIYYKEVKSGLWDVKKTLHVPNERVFNHWANPHFWGRNAGAVLLGYDDDGKTTIAIEPTELGERILDEIFNIQERNSNNREI